MQKKKKKKNVLELWLRDFMFVFLKCAKKLVLITLHQNFLQCLSIRKKDLEKYIQSLRNGGFRAVEKGRWVVGGVLVPLPLPTISLSKKKVFHIRLENIKFLHVNNIWDFIHGTRHKRQKVDSFFWNYRFSSKLSYHSYQQQVCKCLLLKIIFIKRIAI